MNNSQLYDLMNPKSVAIVGAGNNPMKMGTMHALSITKDGYQGRFYPIHPKEKTILGHTAYTSVAELPETPDLAVLVVPAGAVPELLEAFGRKGTRSAIIVTAGFKETGIDGLKQEERLNAIAAQYGMRFIGPNCIGIINSHIRLNTTVQALPQGKPGHLGFVSQSGTYVTQTLAYLGARGIRFSKAVSVGNEANVNMADVLEYLDEDDETKAIAVYIEGLRDARRFLETARRITPHKPIVAQYVGGSEAGARSGLSHTGALAGPDYLYNGLFKQAGIIRVDTVEELYSFGWALACQPRLKGNRVAVMTNSGGPGSAIAHMSNAGGLTVPAFDEALQTRIKTLVPPHAPTGNPVDMTFSTDVRALTENIPTMILDTDAADGVLIHGAMMTGFIRTKYRQMKEMLGNVSLEDLLAGISDAYPGALELPKKYDIPLIISSFYGREDKFTAAYQDNDVPVLDAPEKAARAMVTLLRYNEVRARRPYTAPQPAAPAVEAQAIIQSAMQKGRKALDEHAAKQVLRAYGVPVCREVLVTDADALEASCEQVGFPLVLKGCSSDILHKTEQGLVHLNLTTLQGVREAYTALQKAAGRTIPVLVAEMIGGRREFLAGMLRDAYFGPCLTFGLGGIFTEVLKDAAFRLAPVSQGEAEEMLDDFKASALLDAQRGMTAVDRPALTKLICALGDIAFAHPEISEIDLNPVMIRGDQPVVVDALITLS